MENIYDFGRVPYEPAVLIRKSSFFEKCLFVGDVCIDFIKTFMLGIPLLFISFYHLFVSRAKKSVVGQTVLVTGGGNGIGKEIAIRFACEGCNIAIADMDIQAAEKTAKELGRMKNNIIARAYHVDITDTDQIRKLKIQIEEDISPVDILINNAGIIPMLSLREGTEKEVDRIIQVNITAHLHVTRTFLPGMIERKRGHIAALASMSALHPVGGAVIYSTTKSAVHTFMLALHEEMRQDGHGYVKCTSILPYMVSTRKDIIEAAHFRFPVLSPKDTADIAVDGILRNEVMLSIPRFNLWLTRFFSLFPYSIEKLNRDIVLREKGKRLFSQDNKKMKSKSQS